MTINVTFDNWLIYNPTILSTFLYSGNIDNYVMRLILHICICISSTQAHLTDLPNHIDISVSGAVLS